ncbi:hypothetical protein [Paraferrimonas sp. SM1919]|uniref:hypothetical protein n=1 Tax=Paraferrimonas sp. SM1919 TaxID=2662263 RepID=UPI0013D49537|nr:hypothetical protein [Paraferrimonas sp. SM1919]
MKNILITMLLLWLFGCAASSKIMMSDAKSPLNVDDVSVVYAVPENSELIAILEGRSIAGLNTQQKVDGVIQELKKQSAAIGANLVLITRPMQTINKGLRISSNSIGYKAGQDEYRLEAKAFYNEALTKENVEQVKIADLIAESDKTTLITIK